MKPILHRTSAAILALGLFAVPALAAGNAGAAGGAAPSAAPGEAAGSTGIPGANSVTGANTDTTNPAITNSGSTMGKSQAEAPNNDAGTPMNTGPKTTGTMHDGTMNNGTLNPGTGAMHQPMTPGAGPSGQ